MVVGKVDVEDVAAKLRDEKAVVQRYFSDHTIGVRSPNTAHANALCTARSAILLHTNDAWQVVAHLDGMEQPLVLDEMVLVPSTALRVRIQVGELIVGHLHLRNLDQRRR